MDSVYNALDNIQVNRLNIFKGPDILIGRHSLTQTTSRGHTDNIMFLQLLF